MASTVESASPGTGERRNLEVPLWRLYVMRAIALLFVVSGFFNHLPGLIDPSPTARGMTISMLGGLWVLAFLALRHPLLMVPIYLFDSSGRRSGCSLSGFRSGWRGRGRRD